MPRNTPLRFRWCLVPFACLFVWGCEASNTESKQNLEREKLLAERLELERQRVDLERQKREALEEKIKTQEAAERVQEFSSSDFAAKRDQITGSADSLGRMLIAGTHPTGLYSFTNLPIVSLSNDRRDMNVTLMVHWRGLSKNVYDTTFAFNISKKSGVGILRVIRDTAIFQVEPECLRKTEALLKEMLRTN